MAKEDEDKTPDDKDAVKPDAVTPTAVTTTTPVNVLAPSAAASPVAPTPPSPVAPPPPSPIAPPPPSPVAPAAAALVAHPRPGRPPPAPAPAAAPVAPVVAPPAAETEEGPGVALATAKSAYDKKIEAVQSRINKLLEEGKADEKLYAKETETVQGQIPQPKALEYKPPKPVSLPEQWGSFAMMFAMLGSMFTRTPAVTALNAAAAAMNGFKEGNKEAAEQEYKNWKTASDNLRMAQEFQQKHYDELMKDIKERRAAGKTLRQEELTAARAEMTAAATAFRDDIMIESLKDRSLRGAEDLERKRETASLQAEQMRLKIEKAREESEADKKFGVMLASGELNNLTLDEQATVIGSLNSPKGMKWLSSHKAQEAMVAGKVRAARDTDAFKAADELGKLAILADAGDRQAEKELVKLTAKQAAQKLDGSVDAETQRANDEAIASYSQAPPPQSARNKVAQKLHDDTLARVRKINPQYDPSLKKTTDQIRAGWMDASKPAGKQVQTYNTITHHLTYLDEMVAALEESKKTGNQETFNRVATKAAAAIGNPSLAVTNIDAAQRVIADEITKGVIGSAGALVDREKMAELFDPRQSISVFKDNIRILQDLVGGRFAAAQKSFESGTLQKKDKFWELLEDDTKRAFGKQLGIPAAQIPKKEGAAETTTGAPAAGAPAAGAPGAAATDWAPTKEMQMPGGRIIGAINGKWIYKDTREEVK